MENELYENKNKFSINIETFCLAVVSITIMFYTFISKSEYCSLNNCYFYELLPLHIKDVSYSRYKFLQFLHLTDEEIKAQNDAVLTIT